MSRKQLEDFVSDTLGGSYTPVASPDDQQLVRGIIAYVMGTSEELPVINDVDRDTQIHRTGVATGTLSALETQGVLCTNGRRRRADDVRPTLP